jgi:alpha-tubulin suppressor-like RCC1 family protein
MSLFKRLIGRVACWGNGDHGRLGGHPIARAIPTIVDALMHQNFVSIKCGGAHTAAVGVDGSVFTWGLNDHGQLGHYTHQEISMQAGLIRTYRVCCANSIATQYAPKSLRSQSPVMVFRSHRRSFSQKQPGM